MIRAVVFDLGKVLADPPDIYSRPAAILGCSADEYESAYWQGRRDYDGGGSAKDYWEALCRGLGVADDLATVTRLMTLDAQLWNQIRPDALQIVREVKATGTTTAVLSNAPAALGRALEGVDWRDQIDHWFISADLGITKPDRAIYNHVTDALDLEPNQIAFVDDRPSNVLAAVQHGWHAHLWVDDDDTRLWLRKLAVLV